MIRRCHGFTPLGFGPAVCFVSFLMLSMPACSEDEISSGEMSETPESTPHITVNSPTPRRPQMPAGWRVLEDQLLTGSDLTGIELKLGVKLTGVRNTMFDIGGKQVKVNTLAAADPTSAHALMKKLGAPKPEEFLLQKGFYIYEFVCTNDAIPNVREGKKHLARK